MNKFAACLQQLEKTALLERLVRLGATPIKGTPELLMKSRSPVELKALQQAVESGWNRNITQPIMNVLEKPINKIPSVKLRAGATWAARRIAEDPVGMGLAEFSPVPGTGFAYQGLKKGLEKAIDYFAPLS